LPPWLPSRLAENLLRRTRMRSPAVQSRPVYERPGYRTLLGRLRENVRTYIRKQLALPREEIAEIIRANVGAAKWFGVALTFLFAFLIALVVLIIALIALVLPVWASALIVLVLMGLGAGITGFVGYKRLDLRGPTRTINSMKETIRWAKQRLLGRSAS
jgi:putative superfamily III holin-X